MNKNVEFAVWLIGTGLILGTSLVVYAHSNFATKEAIIELKESRNRELDDIKSSLQRIENKIDSIEK